MSVDEKHDILIEWFSILKHKFFYVKLPCTDGLIPCDSDFALTNITIDEEKIRLQDTTFYRVYSDPSKRLGAFWTRHKPVSPYISKIDLALPDFWKNKLTGKIELGNSATRVVTAKIPAGTKIFEGQAASQGHLPGGGNQVIINSKISENWVTK